MTEVLDKNIAGALTKMAQQMPQETALVAPNGTKNGMAQYTTLTYEELETRSNQAAQGLEGFRHMRWVSCRPHGETEHRSFHLGLCHL